VRKTLTHFRSGAFLREKKRSARAASAEADQQEQSNQNPAILTGSLTLLLRGKVKDFIWKFLEVLELFKYP
jgi:hypothetical protein